MWSELKDGLTFSSNGAFCTFFFFFFWISAWIGRFGGFGRYGRFRPKSAQFSTNQPNSEPRQCESARVGFKKKKDTWHDAAGRAGSGFPRASPCPTASDAGAAPLVPRPCFTASPSPIHIPANKNFKSKNRESKLKLLIWNDNIHTLRFETIKTRINPK